MSDLELNVDDGLMPFQCPACKNKIRVPKPLTISTVNKPEYSMIMVLHPESPVECAFCKTLLAMFIPAQMPACGYVAVAREGGIVTPSQAGKPS